MSSKSAYILTILIILGVFLTVVVYTSINNRETRSLNASQSFYLKFANNNEMDAVSYSDSDWHPDLIKQLEKGPSYLSKDLEINIDPPPSNSSDEVLSELHELMSLKSQRSEAQIEYIHYENNYGPALSFVNEGLIDPKTHPITFDLMGQVDLEVVYFTLREKMRYKRARPTQLAQGLEPVIAVPKHASYPSGHTAQSYAMAILLGLLDPENEKKYLTFALDIGKRREIAGVHYRSDTKASISLAKQVMSALLENEVFNELVTLAKQEYISSMRTHPTVSDGKPLNNGISYADNKWANASITKLEKGPDLLPVDLDIDLPSESLNDPIFVSEEIDGLVKLKSLRDEKNLQKIFYEDSVPFIDIFVEEELLSELESPVAIKLINMLHNEVEYFVYREAMNYKRARPSQLDKNIEPVINNPNYASYPSMFAALSYSTYLMLSELDPDHKDVYERFAKDVAFRREIAGVQYKSDTDAGFLLAEKIVAQFIKQDEVLALLEQAKYEIKKITDKKRGLLDGLEH